MYKARYCIKAQDYPLRGPDPIMVPLRAHYLDTAAIALQNGDSITWQQAHALLYFISQQTRLFLKQELDNTNPDARLVQFNDLEPNFSKNTLNGACNGAALFSAILAHKLGVSTHRFLHTRECFYDDFPVYDHAFTLVGLPIKNEHKESKTHYFVIDTTYRQFLNPEVTDSPNSIDKRVTLDFPTHALTDHLLKFGFIYMGKGANKTYLQNFLVTPNKWYEEDHTYFMNVAGTKLSNKFNTPFFGPYLDGMGYEESALPSTIQQTCFNDHIRGKLRHV